MTLYSKFRELSKKNTLQQTLYFTLYFGRPPKSLLHPPFLEGL